MMKTLPTKLSYILLMFLVACTPVASPISIPTGQPEILSTTELTPTSTASPTPSPNIINLASASELPLPAYKQECANVLYPRANEFEKILLDFSATGTAIFSDIIDDNGAVVLYDLQSGAKRTLPAEPGLGLWADSPVVSPDGKWLFYLTGNDNNLSEEHNFVLSNSKGESIKTIPVPTVSGSYDFLWYHEWLNNNSLRILSRKNYWHDKPLTLSGNKEQDRHDDLVVFLLDPFTEQITQLSNEFDGLQPPLVKNYGTNPNGSPNLQYLDWGVDPFFDVIIFLLNGANVTYSPDRNIVFYPHRDGYAILYNAKNQKELAHVVIPGWGELPKWSPSGDYISFIATPLNSSPDSAKKDFYLLSNDGKHIKRLTYLSEQFERVSIKEYSWSPDGTKIAFWLNTNFPLPKDEIVTYELAVVDVTNGNVANYCISYLSDKVEELASRAGVLIEPVWSPDSSQLLVPNRTPAKNPGPLHDYDVKTYLFNPSKSSAIEIMESIRVSGWMINDQ